MFLSYVYNLRFMLVRCNSLFFLWPSVWQWEFAPLLLAPDAAYQDTPHCKIECHFHHLGHKEHHHWLVYLSRLSYFWLDSQCHQLHCRQSHRHPMQSRIPIDSQLKRIRFYFCIQLWNENNCSYLGIRESKTGPLLQAHCKLRLHFFLLCQ